MSALLRNDVRDAVRQVKERVWRLDGEVGKWVRREARRVEWDQLAKSH